LPQAALSLARAGNTPTKSAAEMTLSDLPPQNLQIPTEISPLPKRRFYSTAIKATNGLAPVSKAYIPAPLAIDECAIETITDEAISPRKRRRLSRYELLHDGGDHLPKARVRRDWRVLGINPEDTVVHYDTLGGRTEVSASNRVSIYAPRFAATRQVNNAIQYETSSPAARLRIMADPIESESRALAEAVKQQIATVREISDTVPQALQDGQRGLNVDQTDIAKAVMRKLLPFENLEIIRTGIYDSSEAVFVEKYAQAAQAWTEIQTVQLVLDNQPASVLAKTTAANEAFEYVLPDGKARVRIIKLASISSAHAGETVQFTLRFDNVGDEAVGNVTIIDNLTTRLEYIVDSQECSLTAGFSADDNEGQSSLLRWEIVEPLEPGEGGIIRFECQVR
jgi:uncharacterized repeat protein (TIGR01451 family)